MHTGYLTGLSQRCYLDGELWPRSSYLTAHLQWQSRDGASHLPSCCLWSPDGKNEKEPKFPLPLILHVPLIQSPTPIQNTPFSFHSNTHPEQEKGKKVRRRRKKKEERDQDQREGQGSLYLSVRSGGLDVNPPMNAGVWVLQEKPILTPCWNSFFDFLFVVLL